LEPQRASRLIFSIWLAAVTTFAQAINQLALRYIRAFCQVAAALRTGTIA